MSEPRLKRFYGTAIEKEFCEGRRFMELAASILLRRELSAEESWGLDEWLASCYSHNPSKENELLKAVQGCSLMERQPQGEGS